VWFDVAIEVEDLGFLWVNHAGNVVHRVGGKLRLANRCQGCLLAA